MLRILIADDHAIVRIGVRFILKEHFKDAEIQEVTNGDELISSLRIQPVDVVILDLNMPDTDPQRILQTILVLKPEIGVIIFSMSNEDIFGKMYLALGARGFVKKDSDELEIVRAVESVVSGRIYTSSGEAVSATEAMMNSEITNPYAKLSGKETELLQHLASGKNMKEACLSMNISGSTAGLHRNKIITKLRVKTMEEVLAITELYPIPT